VPAALSKGADDPLRLTAKALKYFEKAVPIRERIWDWARLAVSFHNIGEALYAMRRSEEALDYFDRALKLEDQVDDYAGKAATLYAKARLLHGTEEPASETLAQTVLAEAIETLQSKSLKITSAGTSLEYMLELLEDWRAARPTVPAPGPTI